MSSNLVLLVDFGSTYTKVTAVDLGAEALLGTAQSPSTVDTDVTIGLEDALRHLETQLKMGRLEPDRILACSSAAGGLRIVAIGLVPELTAEAAKRAALGAGAKVVKVYSYRLSPSEVKELEAIAPDMVLLAGGTDGGNEDCILNNARSLASSQSKAVVVAAGNKVVADDVQSILTSAGKDVRVTRNVMPELGQLDVEPARSTIRELFMERIVEAKGLGKAKAMVGDVLMPTPMAVLNAARLLADGSGKEPGLGELVVVDVGGATTDVHSIAKWVSHQPSVVLRGLPEPYAKRTVEGDLGLRINACSILELAGEEQLAAKFACPPDEGRIQSAVVALSKCIQAVPETDAECALDIALARTAVDMAMERHAGVVQCVYAPSGAVWLQAGKDLTEVEQIIGTGGVFAYGTGARQILEEASFKEANPTSLRPKKPRYYVDKSYIMYAMGLLSSVSPEKALRIMKKNLKEV